MKLKILTVDVIVAAIMEAADDVEHGLSYADHIERVACGSIAAALRNLADTLTGTMAEKDDKS